MGSMGSRVKVSLENSFKAAYIFDWTIVLLVWSEGHVACSL